MDVYPMSGFMVAKHNYLEIKYLPFKIPIPYYPFMSKSAMLNEIKYFPEIGSDQVQGTYAIYKASYLTKDMSGPLDVGYTEKLSYIIGGSNLYKPSQSFSNGFKYHFYPDEKTYHYIQFQTIHLTLK